MSRLLASLTLASLIGGTAMSAHAEDKKIVMIAGRPSHGPGQHEHNAGVLLFKKCLEGVPGIKVETHSGGWPADPAAFDGAAAILIYGDGGRGHPALQQDRLSQLSALMAKGVGFAAVHYGVEPTREKGQKEFLEWMGGCFEIHRSVNPHWEADFTQFPAHPIARGVKPFKMLDEWYFNMRFVDDMKGVTPILTAVPGPQTMSRPDGTHSGNPDVRKAVAEGKPQHLAWAYERADGGRGFGFTGGHFHKNWADENMRKVMLNAILWVAKVEVPANGVESKLTAADLEQNLDPKGRPRSSAPANSAAPASPATPR